MKKFNFSHLMAVALVALSLLAFGCQQPEDPTKAKLEGTWVNSYTGGTSSYQIDGSNFKSWGTYGNKSYESYEGEDVEIEAIDDTSGYIYFKYTKAMNSDFTYSTTAPDVGKWYAVSYKNLTDNSLSISGAYKIKGKTSADSLDDAKAEFTIANGYYSLYSDCTKKQD